MTSRRDRFLRWWQTARSTWLLATWESRFWALFGVLGILIKPLRESIPVLFFLSAYANCKGAAAQGQSAKMEMLQEEAQNPADSENQKLKRGEGLD